MYLLIAKYSDDAGRKRIEYLLDRWRGKINISKPDGIAILLDGLGEGDITELLEDVLTRVSKDDLTLFSLDQISTDVERSEKELRSTLSGDERSVGRLVNLIMARYKGILKTESSKPIEKVYEIQSRKGRAEVSIRLRETSGMVHVWTKIMGYGEVVDFIHSRLSEEMKYLESEFSPSDSGI